MFKYYLPLAIFSSVAFAVALDFPSFQKAQPEMFSVPGAFTNAWADFDNDGDLDLFVGFSQGIPNRLYQNDRGMFSNVATELGVADNDETRAVAWGDFDNDGYVDLFVGFSLAGAPVPGAPLPYRVYRNEEGRHFSNVAANLGVEFSGAIRQVNWIDFDSDGDLDLFVSLRDRPNVLFKNDNGRFEEIAKTIGLADPRRSLGAVWFDYDQDGDLDLFLANNDGDLNGFYRNDRTKFVNIAKTLGVEEPRSSQGGNLGVSACLADFNNDGKFDFFVTNESGPSMFFSGKDAGFVDVAPMMGLSEDRHQNACVFADFDNDSRPDLYVTGFLVSEPKYRDFLYHNESGPDGLRFVDATPPVMIEADADHSVQWADYDGDGDLDAAFTHSDAKLGNHFLFQNMLPREQSGNSLQVLVLDKAGHFTRAGSEVRLYAAGTRRLLGTGIVDTGSGYNSQNAMPLHFGLLNPEPVDIEVTSLTGYERTITRSVDVDPTAQIGSPVVVRVP